MTLTTVVVSWCWKLKNAKSIVFPLLLFFVMKLAARCDLPLRISSVLVKYRCARYLPAPGIPESHRKAVDFRLPLSHLWKSASSSNHPHVSLQLSFNILSSFPSYRCGDKETLQSPKFWVSLFVSFCSYSLRALERASRASLISAKVTSRSSSNLWFSILAITTSIFAA